MLWLGRVGAFCFGVTTAFMNDDMARSLGVLLVGMGSDCNFSQGAFRPDHGDMKPVSGRKV
jgi:hypothetical protein